MLALTNKFVKTSCSFTRGKLQNFNQVQFYRIKNSHQLHPPILVGTHNIDLLKKSQQQVKPENIQFGVLYPTHTGMRESLKLEEIKLSHPLAVYIVCQDSIENGSRYAERRIEEGLSGSFSKLLSKSEPISSRIVGNIGRLAATLYRQAPESTLSIANLLKIPIGKIISPIVTVPWKNVNKVVKDLRMSNFDPIVNSGQEYAETFTDTQQNIEKLSQQLCKVEGPIRVAFKLSEFVRLHGSTQEKTQELHDLIAMFLDPQFKHVTQWIGDSEGGDYDQKAFPVWETIKKKINLTNSKQKVIQTYRGIDRYSTQAIEHVKKEHTMGAKLVCGAISPDYAHDSTSKDETHDRLLTNIKKLNESLNLN